MLKILESDNYERFEMLPFNRDVKKIKYLEASMKQHGWLDPYPLHVQQDENGKLKIKAGHHRFFVARKLGITIKYVISEDNASIYELEKATNRWLPVDYLDSFCRLGKPDYIAVKKYCEETGICIHQAIGILGGQSAGSGGNFLPLFKTGNYKIKKNDTQAETIKEIILHLKNLGIEFYHTPALVSVISKILWIEEFDVDQFKNKLKVFRGSIEKKGNIDQYLDMVEDIYNRQSRTKVPVKFLAIEACARRSISYLF